MVRAALILATALAMIAPAARAEAPIVSHGVSAFGQLKYPADFPHFDYVNPDAPKGGELSTLPVVATRTFDNFNLYILRGDAADGFQYLYDSLLARAYDEPDSYYGLLAETIEMDAQRTYATFNLRPEALFADGSPVTAEDVAFSIAALRDEGAPFIAIPLRPVVDITVETPHRIRFDFDAESETRDLASLIGQLPIFSKADFADKDFSQPTLEPPLSSGPYRVARVTPGRSVVYQRREDYWGRDLPVMRGQFNFDRLRYEYFQERPAALEAFKAGVFDFYEVFFSKLWAQNFDFDAVKNGLVKKEVISDGRPSGSQGFWINTRREKFADPRVRRAIGYAFDFEWSNERLFFGQYARTNSFFENSDMEASGPPTADELALLEPFRDQLDPVVFEEAYEPPVTNGSGRIRGQLRQAGRLLDEAGWRVIDGVRRNAAGEALTIEFLDRTGSGFARIIDPMIANLSRLGIEANMRHVDAAQYERRWKAFNFDILTRRIVPGITPSPTIRDMLSSAAADREGSFNISGVRDPVIDALLQRMAGATSREELRAAAKAVDRVFRAGHYWVPQWNSASHRIAYWDLYGRPSDIGIEKPPFERAVIFTWWYDAEKAARTLAARGR